MKTYTSTMSKLLLALCLALFSTLALTGCGGSDPDADVKSLAEAIGHGDAAAAKEFKLTGDIAKPINELFMQEMGKGIDASKEGIDNAKKTMGDKLKELKFKTEVVSKTDSSAKVKLTTDYIELNTVLVTITTAIQTEMEKMMDQDDLSALDKLGDIVMQRLADEIKNAKIAGQQSFEVEVKKDKDTGKWMPTDLTKFQEDLAKYMLFKGGDDSMLNGSI